ncbi:MAG: hypothetical protein C0613_04520 [Desulfobulbaceae bacterium]|nr:MAG: hypothetical protein C0613_04520 [Desulfobulbaceae bacterium]
MSAEVQTDRRAAKTLAGQKKLHLLVQYISMDSCRKGLIHDYCGMDQPETCQTCDNCLAFHEPGCGVAINKGA